jgi:hypothetical protein
MPLGSFRLNSLAKAFVDLGGFVSARFEPATVTATSVTFTTSPTNFGTNSAVMNASTDEISVTVNPLDPTFVFDKNRSWTFEFSFRYNNKTWSTAFVVDGPLQLEDNVSNGNSQLNVEDQGGFVNDGTFSNNANQWYNWCAEFDADTQTLRVYDGTGVRLTEASYSLRNYLDQKTWKIFRGGGTVGEWYYDELRISNIARYKGTRPAITGEFVDDENTLALLHFNNDFSDDTTVVAPLSGGTTSIQNIDGTDYVIHEFTASDTLTVNTATTVDVLVVGGGGGGGGSDGANQQTGGGGGGGQVNYQASQSLADGSYTIIVGSGGGGGGSSSDAGAYGGTSSAAGFTAIGGAGAPRGAFPNSQWNGFTGGLAGGSGASATSAGRTGSGGSGTQAGGSSFRDGGNCAAGGGGGAVSTGGSGSTGGAGSGGSGYNATLIVGTTHGASGFFAGGGGGAGAPYAAGIGSSGSGGGGQANFNQSQNGATATVNTGSGGGGGASYQSNGSSTGGSGGSGIVLIRYPL